MVFFRWSTPTGLNPIRSIQAQEFLDRLTANFDVRPIDTDCEYAEVLDREKPDLCLFEIKNAASGQIKVSGVRGNASVPKALFLHSDPVCYSRSVALRTIEDWDIDACFALDGVYGYFLPELADRLYTMPHSVDPAQFRDFGLPKTNVVSFFGHFFPQRPWRIDAAQRLRDAFPCTMFPHDTWRTNSETTRMLYGERYARALNATQFAPVEGSYYQLLTRKFFEVPACRAAIVVPRIGALDAFGFVDAKNCIMGEPGELADKIGHFLSDDAAYASLADAGFALVQERHLHSHRTQIADWLKQFRARPAASRVVQDGPLGPFRTELAEGPAALAVAGRRVPINIFLLERGIRALEKRRLKNATQDFIRCMDLLYARFFAEPRFYLALTRLLQGRARDAIFLLISIYIDRDQERGLETLDPRAAAFLILAYLCLGQEEKAREVMMLHAHLARDELVWVRELLKDAPPAPPPESVSSLSLFAYMPMDWQAWTTFVHDAAQAHDVTLQRDAPFENARTATAPRWKAPEFAEVERELLLAVTIGDIVFGYRSAGQRVYRQDNAIYYDLPEGMKLELVSGGEPWSSDAAPIGGMRNAAVTRVSVRAEIVGKAPILSVHAYDENGVCHTVRRKMRTELSVAVPVARAAAVRLGLSLSGRGTLVVNRLRLRFAKAGEPERITPLGQLLTDDYRKGRKSDIPSPKRSTI